MSKKHRTIKIKKDSGGSDETKGFRTIRRSQMADSGRLVAAPNDPIPSRVWRLCRGAVDLFYN
jgi:hypothetical protein